MVMDFLFPPDTKTKGEITIYVVKYMFKINGILLKRIVDMVKKVKKTLQPESQVNKALQQCIFLELNCIFPLYFYHQVE